MPTNLKIVQLGFGGVGQALISQYLALADQYPWLSYTVLADRTGMWYSDTSLPRSALLDALHAKSGGETMARFAHLNGDLATFVPASPSGLLSLATVLEAS